MLVVLSTGGAGLFLTQKYQRRPREVRELIYVLNVLENEIAFLSRRLPEAFLNISVQMKYPMATVFIEIANIMKSNKSLDFHTIWKDALKKVLASTSLQNDELEIINNLGLTLGRTDTDGQVRCIRMAINQLKNQEITAMEVAKKLGTSFRNLGIFLGLGIVILLM